MATTDPACSGSVSDDAESVIQNERVYLHIYDYETNEFTNLTTYHGLVRIYNSQTWPSRIFWCVVVVSCLSLFMIHSGVMLHAYHQKPTLTQVDVIVVDDGLALPDVTICGFLPVVLDKVATWNMSLEVLTYVLQMLNGDYDNWAAMHEAKFLEYKAWYNASYDREFEVAEFFDQTGLTCNDMVKTCSWFGEEITDCCSTSRSVFTDYGKCITFPNVDGTRRQWFSGFDHGFEVVLDPLTHNAQSVPYHNENHRFFDDVGIRVIIHESMNLIYSGSDVINVPPGKKVYSGLDLQNVSLLPKTDWGICQPDWDENIHGTVRIPYGYTAAHCEVNCRLNILMQKCTCVPVALRFDNTLPLCATVEEVKCVDEVASNGEYYSQCNCSIECNRLEYTPHISYSNFVTNKSLSDHVAVVVYMNEIAFEKHEQQRQMQTADLLSNIAGSMGLFLGMSCVTLLEIFIYLFKTIWGTTNTERQRQFVKQIIEDEGVRQNVVVVDNILPSVDAEANQIQRSSQHRPSIAVVIPPSVLRRPSYRRPSHHRPTQIYFELTPPDGNRSNRPSRTSISLPRRRTVVGLSELARTTALQSESEPEPSSSEQHEPLLQGQHHHSLTHDLLPSHQVRRPSVQYSNSLKRVRAMTTLRRPSAPTEVHVQIYNRRNSMAAGAIATKPKSNYNKTIIS